MSAKHALMRELKAMALATAYFGCWIGALVLIKHLVLEEYDIDAYGYSAAIIGVLVLAKVVLVLEHVSLGAWVRARPAWVDMIVRTALYGAGVVVVLLLERTIHGLREHDGFAAAVRAALTETDGRHVQVNAVCITGALLVYNGLTVVRENVGDSALARMYLRPLPRDERHAAAP